MLAPAGQSTQELLACFSLCRKWFAPEQVKVLEALRVQARARDAHEHGALADLA
eukprot:CAMPEP_0202061680 /NCGR_PEP_ID=MMETSP0963-20130614/41849_1 /ASSEMBLY_ACC=CAM_ASM_000494 /TAXON_ID=4773 /ORGANISM="Schizochytrium aggregatum, Strain ATCC28209" /LENGTH=53 /DNA_ID=CAMNT_0048627919 /DNA_START=266 /DNA_END=427 /DNA_ORIENTATION=+